MCPPVLLPKNILTMIIMSNTAYILPVDPIAWKNPDDDSEKPSSDLWISSRQFHQDLVKRFPFANGDYMQDGGSWQLDNDTELGSEVGLSRIDEGYHFVRFKPKGSNYIEFILWFREFVSESYTLYLFGDWSWERLTLTNDTTAEDIKQFLGVQ